MRIYYYYYYTYYQRTRHWYVESNIAENFNRLSRVHERYRRQTDRRQTDGRTTTYSERKREFTFAKKGWKKYRFLPCCMECRRGHSDENSVCLSVCQTRGLWQNGRKLSTERQNFITSLPISRGLLTYTGSKWTPLFNIVIKVLTTNQPQYLHDLISVQLCHNTLLHLWSVLLVHLPGPLQKSLFALFGMLHLVYETNSPLMSLVKIQSPSFSQWQLITFTIFTITVCISS